MAIDLIKFVFLGQKNCYFKDKSVILSKKLQENKKEFIVNIISEVKTELQCCLSVHSVRKSST